MIKKVVFIVPYKDFRDEEYFVTKQILDYNEINSKVASNELGVAQGIDGGEIKINLKITDIEINKFDALIFIGGPGCLQHLDNDICYQLINNFIYKIIAAICISPVILAKAGVLQNKKATVWSSNMDKQAVNILQENKAIFIDKQVVIDNNIITANGPQAAHNFGLAIINKINENK